MILYLLIIIFFMMLILYYSFGTVEGVKNKKLKKGATNIKKKVKKNVVKGAKIVGKGVVKGAKEIGKGFKNLLDLNMIKKARQIFGGFVKQ